MPQLKQRTSLLRRLREVFDRHRSQPVGWVITQLNPILRGWVQYFRVGNASRCLAFVKVWVEQRVRRHLMRARGRQGLGWKGWRTAWLYGSFAACCRLTAAVRTPSIALTAGRARSARPEANVRCACGSSGAPICGAGGVMAWGRGRRRGARGR